MHGRRGTKRVRGSVLGDTGGEAGGESEEDDNKVPSVPGWSEATLKRRVDELVAVVAGDTPIQVIVVTIAFI